MRMRRGTRKMTKENKTTMTKAGKIVGVILLVLQLIFVAWVVSSVYTHVITMWEALGIWVLVQLTFTATIHFIKELKK